MRIKRLSEVAARGDRERAPLSAPAGERNWTILGFRAGIAAAVVVFSFCVSACGGGSSGSTTESNPVPSLVSLSPSSATAGSGAFTLTVNGTGFVSQSTVHWNGSQRTTHYVSSSQLTAQITASDIAGAGTSTVTVVSPTPGGGTSNSITFTTENPVPSLTSLSPSSATAGTGAFTLTVNGSGFVSGSAVHWNGSPRTTSYVSSSQLTAQITASDIANPGTASVTVVTPTPGGGTSNALVFYVNPTIPVISSIAPAATTAGGSAFTLTVNGSGFDASSQVEWNGQGRSTTLVSPAKLTAQIGINDISSAGVATVTVANPPGTTSNPATFIVKLASSDTTAFQTDAGHSGVMYFNPVSFPAQSAWTANFSGQPSYALIADGKVFVTVNLSGSSELVALDQNTGAVVWGPIAISGATNAAYDTGSLFVVSSVIGNPAIMQAFDSSTGALLWSTLLSGQYSFSSGPTALNGFVYTGGAGSGGTLYALDEASGAISWTQPVANGDDSTPAVTADGVYVTYPCQTYDFTPSTGTQIWHSNTGCEGGGGATPVAAEGDLYAPNGVGTYDGMVFDANTGALLGNYSADYPPAITTDDGYFLKNGTLYAIDRSSGTILWTFAGDGHLVTSPIVVNQYVIIGASTGNLYALDRATGQQVWSVNVGAAIPGGAGWGAGIPLSGLAAGHGLLIVPAGNSVVAYRLAVD